MTVYTQEHLSKAIQSVREYISNPPPSKDPETTVKRLQRAQDRLKALSEPAALEIANGLITRYSELGGIGHDGPQEDNIIQSLLETYNGKQIVALYDLLRQTPNGDSRGYHIGQIVIDILTHQ